MNQYINRQLIKYPLMEDIDIYKLIFQACYLNGHMIGDKAIQNFIQDFTADTTKPLDELYEYIDCDVIRVNTRGFCFDLVELLDAFLNSSKVRLNKNFEKMLLDNNFTNQNIIEKYKDGIPSHSLNYHEYYQPSYRIVYTEYLPLNYRIFSLQRFCDKVRTNNKITIICVDGRCASGKSSITGKLNDVTVIHCDDHFGEPVDFEAIKKILDNLKIGEIITEKCYDCGTNSFNIVNKIIKNIVIVEGVYSYHPQLRKYYDYLCLCVVSKEIQSKRLKIRESKESYQKFINTWIKREEKYFSSFEFVQNADILI